MADRIQLRRDTAANWTAYNPILLEGEPGIEIDTDQWKLGDGVHTWSQLAYRGGECVQQRGQSTTVAMSQKAVTDELNLIGVFDISAHNLTDGQPTKYADLTAALGTNGANVPTQYRVPGMTVRYVQSSDNKYQQFRCMADEFTTDVTQWQGVDIEIAPNSKNLAESGSVYNFKDVFSILSKRNNIDLGFIDKKTNCLVYYKDGHIITKNFDSRKAVISEKTNLSFNFSVQDDNWNVVLLVKNGHVITQNFNSADVLDRINILEGIIPVVSKNDWKEKSICIIGDSLTDQGYYISALKEILGCTVYNRGWSGAMLVPTSNYTYNTAYRTLGRFDLPEDNNIDSDHHAGMPATNLIDMMMIYIGTNDWGHGADTSRKVITLGSISDPMSNEFDCSFYAALKYLCYRAKQKYPNVPLVLCTLLPSYAYQSTNSAEYVVNGQMVPTLVEKQFTDGAVTKSDMNNAIREVARIFGAYVIDIDKLIGFPDFSQAMAELYYNEGDMTHPSHTYGAVILGRFIAKQIRDNVVYIDKNIIDN